MNPLSPPVPPSLPAPPLLEHLLLEQPWPLVIPLIVIALVCARFLSRSPRAPRPAWAGTILLLIAGPAVYVLSILVITDREHMRAAVTQLVQAVAKADTPTLDQLLAPDCSLFSRFSIPGSSAGAKGLDKAAILDLVPRTIRANPITESDVFECQPLSRGPGIGTTQLLVRVVVEYQAAGYKLPVQSWWRVDWRRDADAHWRAIAIESLTDPSGAAALR